MNNSGPQPQILRYDSRANELHRPIIQQLVNEAYNCGCMTREIQNKIFGEDGIICAVPNDRDAESVSKRFFGYALATVKEEEAHKYDTIPDKTINRRALLQKVLAVHFSVNEALADNPSDENSLMYDGYCQQIEAFEDFCWDNDIPSVLPNLFLPKSIGAVLKDEKYDPRKEKMSEFYEHLVGLYMHQSKHLQSVLYSMAERGCYEEVLLSLEAAAQMRGDSIEHLIQENEVLAETYVIALYSLERDDDVIGIAAGLTKFFDRQKHIADRYMGSILRTRDAGELERLVNIINVLPLRDRSIQDRFTTVCIEIGWDLFGFGEYDRLRSLLNHIRYTRESNTHMKALFEALEQIESMPG